MDRVAIVKKYAGSKKEPTHQELQEAYGYLDYCIDCGSKITILDRLLFNCSHSFFGNRHRWKCWGEKK